MPRFLYAMVGLFVGTPAGRAELLSPKTVITSNEGVKALGENLPYKAQEKFIKALEHNPYSPEIHLNLAFSFFKQGQMDKARSEYETALKLANGTLSQANKNKGVEFIVNHNLGAIAHLEKKVEMALDFYQKALDINPESKETKTNIELLLNDNQNGGSGDSKDDQQKKEDNKDQKSDGKEGDKDDDKDDDKDKNKDEKKYSKNKPPPPKFKSEQLTEGDVKKILGELRQQEQKIRAEFNKKEVKEKPNEKDW